MRIFYNKEKGRFSLYGGEGYEVYCTLSFKTKRIKVIEMNKETKELIEGIYNKFDLITHLNDENNKNSLVKIEGIEN